jgi:hypothetical protein
MAQMICQFAEPVRATDGVPYVAQVWAEHERTWQGWLVFIAADGRILRTVAETSQTSRDAVRAWAASLAPPYLAAALARAMPASAALPAA